MKRKNHSIPFSKCDISKVDTGNGDFKIGPAHSELRNKQPNQMDHCVRAYKRMLGMSREIKSLATSLPQSMWYLTERITQEDIRVTDDGFMI